VITSPGGQDAIDPPTTADTTLAYIVETFDNGPPPGGDGGDPNAVIPTLLYAPQGGGTQTGPLNYGSIPGWGNTAFWQ
jgi:hypothetical protein